MTPDTARLRRADEARITIARLAERLACSREQAALALLRQVVTAVGDAREWSGEERAAAVRGAANEDSPSE